MRQPQASRLNAVLLTLLLVTVLLMVAWGLSRPAEHGLQAVYYADIEWNGEPLLTTLDAAPSHHAMEIHRAVIGQGPFSVEWRGWLDVPQSSVYTFTTASDDGSYLWLDDVLVVDNGGPHGLLERRGAIRLSAGFHRLKVRYFDIGGYAVLRSYWQYEDGDRDLIPSDSLIPPLSSTRLRIFQSLQALFPSLFALWTAALFYALVSAYRASPSFGPVMVMVVCSRLFMEPLRFGARFLRQAYVRYWLATVMYAAMIFLTLSYARIISNILTDRFGDDVFSTITRVALLGIGAAIVVYFVRLRDRLLARLLVFAAVGAVYAYVLSPELRETVHGWNGTLTVIGAYLESLKIFPIAAAEKVHFLQYGLLGLLLCKTLSFHLKDKMAYPLAVTGVYLIGLVDEGIQWDLPERVGEYRDIWLNLLAGALAVVVVWLVLRPKAFKTHARLRSLRPLGYTLAVALVLTGVFVQYVHGFGTAIFLPDSATEFVSVFSEHRLLALDRQHRQRLEGQLMEALPSLDAKHFQYEGRAHRYFRDWYRNHDMLWESYCEQEILKTYYRSYLLHHNVSLHEYDQAQFTIPPDRGQHVFYRSNAQELAITAFSSDTMWTALGISAALLALLASLIPSARTSWRRRCEIWLLRPLFAGALIAMVAWAVWPDPVVERPPFMNVVMLTVDSCQPDYWGAYGYDQNTTPFFDELASEGVLFTNAIAPTSWTIPSLTSMLTGLNPNVHGIDVRAKLMDQRIPTLFEALEAQGYAIGDTSYTLTEPSINSVFKKSDISPEVALSEGRSEESYLLSWMEEHQNVPFFGWVHFHTSHLPYKATPPYNRMFLDDIDPDVLDDEQIRFVRDNIVVRKGEVAFDAERHTPAIHALFAQTLRQQDAKIGKVLMKLDELGLRDNTLLIITADHGDELMEHGFIGHASTNWDSTVYDDLVHVPLLIVAPGRLPEGKRIDAQARMIDLMPTVLDLTGTPFNAPIQGRSLVPLMTDDAPFQHTAYSETTPCGYSCPKKLVNNRLRSVRTNDWKYITVYDDATGTTTEELYNLRDDPAEQQNVIDRHPLIAALYRLEMRRWMNAPAHFPYQVVTSDEEHYLDVDVEVRPIVQFPKVGTVMTPDTHNKRVYLEWTGDPQAEYLIEYEVGKGGYHMTGELDAVGTRQWYGPFPEDIWQALPLYNPWKFRVIPKKYPQFPSEWITFEMRTE